MVYNSFQHMLRYMHVIFVVCCRFIEAGYLKGTCILTTQAAQALALVQSDLMKNGFTLKVYDCYRPQMAVDYFVLWGFNMSDATMKDEFYPTLQKNRAPLSPIICICQFTCQNCFPNTLRIVLVILVDQR